MKLRKLGTVCVLVGAAYLCVPALAQPLASRPAVHLQCVSFGNGPTLECTVRLQSADGAAIENATVTLGATMPSMPMAHTIRPARAVPTARPGEYQGSVELEMLGVWAVEVDVSGQVRDKIVRRLVVVDCRRDQRCPAEAAGPASKGTSHGSHEGRTGRDAHKH